MYLMEHCSQLYMPRPVTETQQLKEKAFRHFLEREKQLKIAKNLQYVETQ